MFPERTGLIVWIHNVRSAKALERYGAIHYVSKKMKYVVLYLNADSADKTIEELEGMNFVKRVERSYRNEIKTEYNTKETLESTSSYYS